MDTTLSCLESLEKRENENTLKGKKTAFEKVIFILLALVSVFHILTVDKGELIHTEIRSCRTRLRLLS